VPNADRNLPKFPDNDQAMEKILDLTLLSDIFRPASTAPSPQASSAARPFTSPAQVPSGWLRPSAQLPGAAVVIVADLIEERLAQARSFGCETVDVSEGSPQDQLLQLLGAPELDAAKVGALPLSLGTGWARRCPSRPARPRVWQYSYGLPPAILHGKVQIAKAVSATAVPLDQAPQGYADVDSGAAKKYVIDPNGMLA